MPKKKPPPPAATSRAPLPQKETPAPQEPQQPQEPQPPHQEEAAPAIQPSPPQSQPQPETSTPRPRSNISPVIRTRPKESKHVLKNPFRSCNILDDSDSSDSENHFKIRQIPSQNVVSRLNAREIFGAKYRR